MNVLGKKENEIKVRDDWQLTVAHWRRLASGPTDGSEDWLVFGKKNKMKKRKWEVIKKMEKWEEGGRRMERENVENEWKEMRLVGGESGSVWAKVKKNRRRKWRKNGEEWEKKSGPLNEERWVA